MSGALFDDVRAMERVSKALVQTPDVPSLADVAAVERGRRKRPDGTLEEYQRVEFRERS